jgi:Zinc-binding dehydrogenase
VVVDLANSSSFEDKAVLEFFETSGRNLLAAEVAAGGVWHHVALSIVGTDRSDNGYFRAKVAQEKLIETSGIPYTIIRSTQFLEFLGGIAASSADGNIVRISPGKVAINAAIIAKKPDRLSHAEAAALALTGLTALTAIEDTAQLKAGHGAGGVAGFGVQLAKHLGETVITTASASNHPYVRSLGADQVIDYNAEDFTAIGPICDMVFDTVGGDVRAGCYAVLKPGGKLVWIAPAPEGFHPTRNDVQTLRPNVIRDRGHLERILTLLDAGAVRPPAIVRYKLADAAEAHRVSEARHLQGKLVLAIH